jgi:hypothetical protein
VDEKLFELMAQAEDIQEHAVTLQKIARDAISELQEATKLLLQLREEIAEYQTFHTVYGAKE